MSPWGRSLLFPSSSLATHFGRDDADYAIGVFLRHYRQLSTNGFSTADKFLEVGPGRNLGTSLLMWAMNHSRAAGTVTVILWGVSPNMIVDANAEQGVARALLESPVFHDVKTALPEDRMDRTLGAVAAIEHVWNMADFWRGIIGLTKAGGWHSHRIDLADHGRRETNYIARMVAPRLLADESLCAWRHQPLARLNAHDVPCRGRILSASRETREVLPITRWRVNRAFRALDELDLRTTAVDLVALKTT